MSSSPVPVSSASDSAEAKAAAKSGFWSVGTLTYTKAGLLTLFGWLLWGDFAWALRDRMVAPVVPLLLRNFEATDKMIGLIMGTIPAAIGLFLGPIISFRSDRKRSRWGRRIPYLLVTTPIASISIICCAFSGVFGRMVHDFWGEGAPSVNLLSLLCFGIAWTIFEFAVVAANAVFGGLVNDVVPNTFLGRFFGMFRAVSLLAGIIFNLWLIEPARQYYMHAFTIVGLMYGVGFTMMALRVKEGEYPPVTEAEAKASSGVIASAKTYFRECFRNPYYWWVFAAVTLGPLAFVPINTFSVLYAGSLGIDLSVYGKYIAITFTISLSIAYFLGVVADKLHPLRLAIATMAAYALLSIWACIGTMDRSMFTVAFIGHGVVSGMFFTTTASLFQRIFPRERFAQFGSAAGILTSLANMVVPFVAGYILDNTGHNYRHTFLMGAVIATVAIVGYVVVYRKFMALGGPKGYVAPL